ncbi:substrate-binding periplasmic protein [Martelella mediterranea]|uniref:Amino acid ABC transporter substrate-binding protein (PAAT family) n=1 Tax=Martelella mediterranea TaxID=293089 RepID=A0A4R3NC75_9HYPH|nr:transporter substrate-binding domain-containing protein [Martelella mediterranea]TCT27705.1 amino acid ABC transporter substrate-binding protein (PAAT family) [Martelella mediterranea]
MTTIKTTLIATAFLACTVPAAMAEDCTPKHSFETVKPGTLSLVATTYRPATWIENGEIMGIEGEILKHVAAMECLEIEARPVDAAAGLNYITRGRADISAGGWYRTAERDKVLDFSAPLYLDQMAIVSTEDVNAFDELEGQPVGTVQGDLWVPELKTLFGSQLKLYPNFSASLQDLRNGRISANFASNSVIVNADSAGQLEGFYYNAVQPDERVAASMMPSQVGFPVPEGSADFQAAINADVQQLREDGTLAEILKRHGLEASAANVGDARFVQ